jgi:hypothetical protein
MIIQDPATGTGAKVDTLQRLIVLADQRPAISRAAEEGLAVVIHSTYSATTGQQVLQFKNNDPLAFNVSSIQVASAVAGSFVLAVCTGTAAGTAATKTNLKLGTTTTKLYDAFGNASVTGLTPGAALWQVYVPASGSALYAFGASIIIGNGLQVCVTANITGAISVEMYGFWATV